VCEIKDSEFFKCNFAVEITNGEESPRCLQAKGKLNHTYALLGYPVVAFALACRDDACATYETCTVEDILTPLLVALAFAWVVVLDYEYALGCSDVGYCLELLEFTHDASPSYRARLPRKTTQSMVLQSCLRHTLYDIAFFFVDKGFYGRDVFNPTIKAR